MITLVTGASGHIGANLVRALLAEGRPVRALVHRDERALAGLPVETVVADISVKEDCLRALAGIDTVFHCAAQIAISRKMENGMLQTNIDGTRNLVAGALENGVRRFVHFSSIHALSARPENRPIDETRSLVDHDSGMLYDFSKAEGERIVAEAVRNGLDAVTLNPTAVIGPFDFKPSLMGEFLILLYRGRLPVLVKGGFNWVDVRDVVSGALTAEVRGKTGERYLLGGHWESVSDLAALVDRIKGKQGVYRSLPHWLAHLGVPFLALSAAFTGKRPLHTHDSLRTLTRYRLVSSDKAARELGYTPRPLEETIKDTIEWFKGNGLLSYD